MINIEWNPSKKKLREFGFVTLIGFCIIGLIFFVIGGKESPAIRIAIGGTVLGIITVFAPSAMKWFYCLWMGLAFVMGNIIGRVILIVIYYIVCTLLALIMRIVHRDRLNLKKTEQTTYWKMYEGKNLKKDEYQRLF